MRAQDMRIDGIALAGEDGMLNLHMVDRSDPSVTATIVYDRESGELFDAYRRENGCYELGERETIQLLATAMCQLAKGVRA